MKYKRVCIQLCGYAIVEGDTDEETMVNVQKLNKSDFDWEAFGPEVLADAKIVEDCNPSEEG